MPHANWTPEPDDERVLPFPSFRRPQSPDNAEVTNELLDEVRALRREIGEMRRERLSPIITGGQAADEYRRLLMSYNTQYTD